MYTAIFCFIFFALPYTFALIAMKKRLKSHPLSFAERTIIITEDGFTAISDKGTQTWAWATVRSAGMSDEYIYISVLKHGFYIIPIRFFSSKDEAVKFVKPITDHVVLTRAGKPKSLRRLYYWGLLGFLPNFGAIAGLILLIKGIFQFKDLKLVLIGIADIAFTICFWWFFTSFTENSSLFLSTDKKIVRDELNSNVKAIEFYKLQNGFYPDSLPQLMNDDCMFAIYDLFSKEKHAPRSYFTYYKTGNRYTIFSVGPDGKPNTADDIYPTVAITDSTRIGLIRK